MSSKIRLRKKRKKEIKILSKFNEFTLRKKVCILKALKSGVDITAYGDSCTPIDVLNILFKYKETEDQHTVAAIIDACNERGYKYNYLVEDTFNRDQLNILYISISTYNIDPSDFARSHFSANRMKMYVLLVAENVNISDILSDMYTDKYIRNLYTVTYKLKHNEDYDISKEKNYINTYDEIIDHIRTLECPF